MFLSAAFLAGLAAVAIPVVIHLIHRQRYPDRTFTTLRFFDKTVKHNVVQKRLIDRILLLLRVLALVLLAVGLSRPFWHASVGERRMSAVIVLDNSPSMARVRDGKTLLDHAKGEAAAILEQLGPSDRAEIVLTAGGPGGAAITDRAQLERELKLRSGQPTAMLVAGEKGAALSVPGLTSDGERLKAAMAKVPAGTAVTLAGYDDRPDRDFGYDKTRLRGLLDGVKVSAAPGDMRGALATAGELMATSRDGDRKVVVISDVQNGKWDGDAIKQLDGLDVSVITTDPSGAAGPNLGIEGCSLSQNEVGFGQRVTATFTVRNYGRDASPQATLTVVAGERDRPAEVKVPAIAGGSSMLVSANMTVPAGVKDNLLCAATIVSPTDPFAYDNSWYFQVRVRPQVSTLCVNGAAGAAGADRSTFFVMNALSTRAGGAAAAANAKECELETLKDQKLFEYAVLVLADVKSLEPDSRKKIREYVSDGHGLLVFANPGATAEEYNGWGFLPGRVTAQRNKTFLYVKSVDARSSAVADVRERAGTAVHALSTDASLAIEPAEGATVLARFSDGSPALLEGRIGKGRVIVVAASCHVSLSDWPLRPAFVLMVRDLVQDLGRTGASQAPVAPQRTVGEGAAMAIPPERGAGTPASFKLIADGTATAYQALPWYRDGNRMMLPRASAPGQYVMAIRPEAAEGLLSEPGLGANMTQVSVNHSPRESDLTPARAETIRRQLPGARVTVTALGGDVGPLRTGRELWRWLLIGALAFLVAESLIAWRWASESSQ